MVDNLMITGLLLKNKLLTNQEKENNFRQALQAEAEKSGCVFFEDIENGIELETSDMIGWDMFGFLIPKELEEIFQIDWEKDNTEPWDSFLVSEHVSIKDDQLVIVFNSIP